MQNGSCLIEGNCHRDGEQNAGYLMCKPSVSQTSWSVVPGVKGILKVVHGVLKAIYDI